MRQTSQKMSILFAICTCLTAFEHLNFVGEIGQYEARLFASSVNKINESNCITSNFGPDSPVCVYETHISNVLGIEDFIFFNYSATNTR